MSEQFQHGQSGRLRLHVLPTKRFKTFAISLFAGVSLKEDTVTAVSLLPYVLRSGTESYPERKLFREKLDDLYGAGFHFQIFKKGDQQITQFKLDIVNDCFVTSKTCLLKEAIAFLGEVITKPSLVKGHFTTKFVTTEKETIRKEIEGLVDDKIRYAIEKCVSEMCKEEPYRLFVYGKKEKLDEINENSLYKTYLSWINDGAFDLYVVGDTDLSEIESYVTQSFSKFQGTAVSYPPLSLLSARKKVQRVEEKLEIIQGKLVLGFRTEISYNHCLFPALLILNGLFGAFPHSKLFQNVRQKASLAYYISSGLYPDKGILLVHAGIDVKRYKKTLKMIKDQLDAILQGEFTEEDLNTTKTLLVGKFVERLDTPFERIFLEFTHVVGNAEGMWTIFLEQLEKVTSEQVIEAATKLRLDTIYFLDRKEEVE